MAAETLLAVSKDELFKILNKKSYARKYAIRVEARELVYILK